jgi:hypothetical protein
MGLMWPGLICTKHWGLRPSIPAIVSAPCHPYGVTDTPDATWLTVPDLTELLGLKVSQVRRLIEDRALLARKIDGVWKVPAAFVVDGAPMSELRGTLIVLGDSGFTDDEAMDWLLSPEDSLGVSPIEALQAGRKAEVRRVAQALG